MSSLSYRWVLDRQDTIESDTHPPRWGEWGTCMTNAAVYARISQDTEGRGLGVARQIADCEAKAKAMGWTVTQRFVDNDVSASKDVPRPQYDRLIAGIKDGTVTALVVYDLDRLTRKPMELEEFIGLSDRHSIALANVSGDIDLMDSGGRMMARVKGALARQEAERIGERVRRKQLQVAQAGKKHKGRYRTFGYDRDFKIIEHEAALVRDAFESKAKGESLTSIAMRFRQVGSTTTGGGAWDASAISKLIKRPDYIGEIRVSGEYVADAEFEALVDRATYDLANQKADESNNRGNNTRKGLLSGFLVCGNCFNKMKRGGNKEGHNYRCPGEASTPGSCGSCTIGGRDTDTAVFNAVWRKEQDGEPPKPKQPMRDFAAEEAAVQAQIDQSQALFESGELALTDHVSILNTLRRRLAELRRESAAQVSQDFGHMRIMFEWDDWTLAQQRLWIEQYVNYVVVSKADRVGIKGFKPERLTVHFKDGQVRRLSRSVLRDRFKDGKSVGVTADQPVCGDEDCSKLIYAKGKCQTHYKRDYRRARAAN